MKKPLKPLKQVSLLVVHCTATKCNRPFSVENLVACGEAKYGQCSYHYYVRRDGEVIPLLPETVQGVHARHYNYCSLGIVYEGGLNEKGQAYDTRTEAQKHALYSGSYRRGALHLKAVPCQMLLQCCNRKHTLFQP